VAKAGRVADLDQQLHRSDRGDPILVGECAAEPAQQGRDPVVELGDPRVQAGDVAGRLDQPGEVDPVGRGDLDRAGRSPVQRPQARAYAAGGWQHGADGQREAGQHGLGLIQQPNPLVDQAFPAVADGDQLIPAWIGPALLAGWRVGARKSVVGAELGVHRGRHLISIIGR
jgi:hypothetical protein